MESRARPRRAVNGDFHRQTVARQLIGRRTGRFAIVCERIRKNPKLRNTRIIIVSGVINRDEIEQMLQLGADDFVKKPFDVYGLIDKIAGMVGAGA